MLVISCLINLLFPLGLYANLSAGITRQLCYTSVLGDNSMVMHRYVQAFIQDFTGEVKGHVSLEISANGKELGITKAT